MAEQSINLNNFLSSGVYTIEIDQSENIVLPLTTGRLVVGSSRVGPFNTVVLVSDIRTLRAVYGEIDPKLEKAGSFFHRTLEVALREGPVFALNVIPLDSNEDTQLNQDQAYFTTFNTEAASNNNDQTTVLDQYPIVEFFNRRRLWFADSTQLNRSKNLALQDDFVTNPGGFGTSSITSNKVLSFVNLGNSNVTIWVRKAAVAGFDVTAKEWYSTVAGSDIEFPTFLHKDDFISDYFVEVIVVNGDWTNYLKLAKDPIYKQFFDESGLKSSKSADFFALREIKVIGRTVGTLIPDFKDQRGLTVSIDRLVNRLFPTTGLMCALDVEKLDLIDLTEGIFTDQDVHTHRVDIVGQGYDDLNLDDVYAADDGGFNPDTTAADFTPQIDVLSYSSPADSELIFKITDADSETNFNAGTVNSNPVAIGDLYEITPLVGDTYLAAMQGSTLYKAYIKGFLRNGDFIFALRNLRCIS